MWTGSRYSDVGCAKKKLFVAAQAHETGEHFFDREGIGHSAFFRCA